MAIATSFSISTFLEIADEVKPPKMSDKVVLLLVAEDERLMKIIKAFPDSSDVEICCEIGDGLDEALKKCLDLNPDLVVLKHEMGGISGFEAAHRIQLLSPKTAIMVIGPNKANLVPSIAMRSTDSQNR